jgi:hypothetical protein
MWLYVNSFRLCVSVGTYLVGTSLYQIGTHRHTQTELIHVQPHTDTLYSKCKSAFLFSNVAKYGHGPPGDGFKRDRNM